MGTRTSLDEMARRLEPGEVVFIPGCTGEPIQFTELICGNAGLAEGVHFMTSFAPGINIRNLSSETRTMGVFMMQPALVDDLDAGRVAFRRKQYSDAESLLASDGTGIDTLIVQVAPPNELGQCSLGPAVEFTPTVLRKARRVFAVLNPALPSLPGSPSIGLDQISLIAHSEFPPATYDTGPANTVTRQIVAHIEPLIPDGATVELGLGKVPMHLQRELCRKKELRLHSGILSDGLLDMIDAGCLAECPIVTTVIVGTSPLYRRLEEVPDLQLKEVFHTHGADALSKLPRFHAINTALQIDLRGCVNAEQVDGRFVSGPGGLPDFAKAARACQDGLSIIALPSTDPRSQRSRIVDRLPADSVVTVPGEDVDIVVTEHGAADLRRLSPDERARAITRVAHPAFRESLTALDLP